MTRLVTLPVCCRVSGTVRCQCSPLQDLDSTVYTGTFSAPPCSFSIGRAPSACVNHAETAPWIVCSLWTLCSVDLCSRWIVFSPWILCSVDLCFLWIVYSLWILWSVDLCSLWILSSVVCVWGYTTRFVFSSRYATEPCWASCLFEHSGTQGDPTTHVCRVRGRSMIQYSTL